MIGRPPDGDYAWAMKNYSVSHRFLRRLGISKFLALPEDVRQLFARDHQRRAAAAKKWRVAA